MAADPSSVSFKCPNCGAKYEIVRVEASPRPTTDREITCLSCGGPLQGRQGVFGLKITSWLSVRHAALRSSECCRETVIKNVQAIDLECKASLHSPDWPQQRECWGLFFE